MGGSLAALDARPAGRLAAELTARFPRADNIREVTRLGVVGCLVKADLSLQQLGDRVTRILADGL